MLMDDPVTITDEAATEICSMMAMKKVPEGYSLRVGVRGGGCGAAGFFLGFDKGASDDDVYDINGVSVLIDRRHLVYLVGQVVDFEERTHERGFFFGGSDG